MYNGIGLQTARGSGTNGYVQRNLSFVRVAKPQIDYKTEDEIRRFESEYVRPPNQEILDHHRKRKIEVQCLELEEQLEKKGLDQNEIDRQVQEYREKLLNKMEKALEKHEEFILEIINNKKVKETHQLAEINRERNDKLKSALGISDDFVAGSSMDFIRKAKEQQAELIKPNDKLIQSSNKEEEENNSKVLVTNKSKSKNLKIKESPKSQSSSSSSSESDGESSSESSSDSSSDSSISSSSSSSSYDSSSNSSSDDERYKKDKNMRIYDEHRLDRHNRKISPERYRFNDSKESSGKVLYYEYHDKHRKSSKDRHSDRRHRDHYRESKKRKYSDDERKDYRKDYNKRGKKSSRDGKRKRKNRSSSISSSSSSPNCSPNNTRKHNRKHKKSRSPSIPRRQGSPSFLEKRRITSARKRPVPYRRNGSSMSSPSNSSSTPSMISSNANFAFESLSPPLRYRFN